MLPAARNAVRNAGWWDVPQSWTIVPVVLPGTSGRCRPADRRFRVLPAPPPGFRERTCLRRGQNARARRGRDDVDRFLFAVFAYIQFFRCVEPGTRKGCHYISLSCVARMYTFRTFSMNVRIFVTSLCLLVSTPLLTSTPQG